MHDGCMRWKKLQFFNWSPCHHWLLWSMLVGWSVGSDQLFSIRVISQLNLVFVVGKLGPKCFTWILLLLFLTPPIFGVFLLNYSYLPPSMTLILLFW